MLLGAGLNGIVGAASGGGGASPSISAMTPDTGSQDDPIDITLADMPAGFTLDDVTFNSVSSHDAGKMSDTQVIARVSIGASTGPVVIHYNSGSTVTSATDFTVI